ncbi:MAG: PH domain-containing protein [Desulfuromonadales bacterium]|nr:PH domain-containing protein [Desulfuromonadales bacterium]
MMQTYRIRNSFVLPLGLVVLLCLILAAIVIIQEQPSAKLLVVGCALLPLGYLLFECVVRRIEVDSDGLRLIRLGRVRAFTWSEITAVETVRVRQRAFLTINAGDDFLIIANMYAGFDHLLGTVLAQVSATTISEETRLLAQAPPTKHSDIVILWGLALMMAYLIYAQFPH